MKRRPIPKPEPPELVLETSDPADPELPKPKNSVAGKASEKVSDHIKVRYQRTRILGGLVPDDIGKGYWRCSKCGSIHDTAKLAKLCCGEDWVQVQICTLCFNRSHELFRIGECRCAKQTK